MHLDVFDIRGIPQFYSWYTDPIGCDYHHDPAKDDATHLRIFAERNIACEAQWLYCFELIVENDAFGLALHRGTRIIEGESVDSDFEIIGTDAEYAIAMFIERIISETTISEQASWEHNDPDIVKKHAAQKDELREKLSEICVQFIKENLLGHPRDLVTFTVKKAGDLIRKSRKKKR